MNTCDGNESKIPDPVRDDDSGWSAKSKSASKSSFRFSGLIVLRFKFPSDFDGDFDLDFDAWR